MISTDRLDSIMGDADLVRRVELALNRRCTVRDGDGLLIAVSGGLDSVVLLDILRRLATDHAYRLEVAHADHQLRPDSPLDADFVQELAAASGLPFHMEQLSVRSRAAEGKVSIEMAARELRHAFLARTARRRGLRSIALAHHADDQLELFFLRLFRGSSVEGIAGTRWFAPSPQDKRVCLARPMLGCFKEELREYASCRGLTFKEDCTNTDIQFERNRVRQELLPLLRASFGLGNGERVLRLMELCGAESEFTSQIAHDWLNAALSGSPSISYGDLALAVQRKVIQVQLLHLGIEPDFNLVERLRTSEELNIAARGNRLVRKTKSGLLREAKKPETCSFEQISAFLGEEGECVFAGRTFKWSKQPGTGQFRPVSRGEVFDARKVGDEVILRHWFSGDTFQPSGMPGPVRLQDLWVNAKVPVQEKHRRVVGVTGTGELFWVEGLRISEKHKVTSSTREELVWNWRVES